MIKARSNWYSLFERERRLQTTTHEAPRIGHRMLPWTTCLMPCRHRRGTTLKIKAIPEVTWVGSPSSCLLKGGVTEPKARMEWSTHVHAQIVMKHGSESSLPSDTCNLRLQPNTVICKVQAGELCHWVTNRKKSQNKSRFCMFMYVQLHLCRCRGERSTSALIPRHYQPCLLRHSLSWAWSSLRNTGCTENTRNRLSWSCHHSLPAMWVLGIESGPPDRKATTFPSELSPQFSLPECFKETSDHS